MRWMSGEYNAKQRSLFIIRELRRDILMKKIFLGVLTITLVFSLLSCANVSDENESDTLNNSYTDVQTEIEIKTWGPTPSSPPIYEYKLESLEEYQAFVSERNLPTKFVRYEDISYLGDFTSLSIFSWEENGPFLPDWNSKLSNIDYMYEFNNGEFYVKFGYNNVYGNVERNSLLLQESFELSYDVMNEKNDLTFVDKDVFETEWSKSRIWKPWGFYEYYPTVHFVYNQGLLNGIVICTDAWDEGTESYTDVEVNITFEPYTISKLNTSGNYLIFAGEKTIADYDFSNEELNKFFYRETLPFAFKSMGEHIARIAE